jgi:hypothetical protein
LPNKPGFDFILFAAILPPRQLAPTSLESLRYHFKYSKRPQQHIADATTLEVNSRDAARRAASAPKNAPFSYHFI